MQEPLLIKQANNNIPDVDFSDEEILDGIKGENNGNKQRYFQNLFYKKYVKYIYKGATIMCRNFPEPEELAKDITQETFTNAFLHIKTFNLSNEKNKNNHQFIIKAWLGRISNNCFLKLYAKRKNEVYENDSDFQLNMIDNSKLFESLFDGDKTEIPNEYRMKLQVALNNIKEEHKLIIFTYAIEDCINNNRHLSDSAMEYLCKTLDTNAENIRQIKKRTLDKIKKFCF